MIAPALLMIASLAAPATVAGMKWQKRVLLVSAADAADPRLAEQRRIVAHWLGEAEARDLVVVEVVGDRVTGTRETAAAVRRRYRLPAAGFAVALVGKDGGTKLRQARPIDAATLRDTIDAMPMRRAGQR